MACYKCGGRHKSELSQDIAEIIEAKIRIVQILNPRENRYVKIDRYKGVILSTKLSEGPYKNIPIAKP